jgi:hypothetical protein
MSSNKRAFYKYTPFVIVTADEILGEALEDEHSTMPYSEVWVAACADDGREQHGHERPELISTLVTHDNRYYQSSSPTDPVGVNYKQSSEA